MYITCSCRWPANQREGVNTFYANIHRWTIINIKMYIYIWLYVYHTQTAAFYGQTHIEITYHSTKTARLQDQLRCARLNPHVSNVSGTQVRQVDNQIDQLLIRQRLHIPLLKVEGTENLPLVMRATLWKIQPKVEQLRVKMNSNRTKWQMPIS